MTDLNAIPDSVKIIEEHLDNFFDADEILVFHEKESEIFHSDIFVVKPIQDRNFNLLLTCGLSALPMKVPKELDDFTYIEKGEKEIYFYSAIPINKEELDYKLEHGIDKLLSLFQHYNIDEVIDINRRNVC